MNYSDYFENKVAAELSAKLAITICDSKNVILKSYLSDSSDLDTLLDNYNYYKVEMKGNSVTVYVHA